MMCTVLLDHNRNKITNEGTKAFTEALKINQTLTSLNIQDDFLHDKYNGAETIPEELFKNKAIARIEQKSTLTAAQTLLLIMLYREQNQPVKNRKFFLPMEIIFVVISHIIGLNNFKPSQGVSLINFFKDNKPSHLCGNDIYTKYRDKAKEKAKLPTELKSIGSSNDESHNSINGLIIKLKLKTDKKDMLSEISSWLSNALNVTPDSLKILLNWLNTDNLIRKERHFFRWNHYGNTKTYQAAVHKIKQATIRYTKSNECTVNDNQTILSILKTQRGRISCIGNTNSTAAYENLKKKGVLARTSPEQSAERSRAPHRK